MPSLLRVALTTALAVAFAGPVRSAWNPDPNIGGLPVCTGPASSISPDVIADGSGGTYLAWNDNTGCHVQRLNADGEPLWPVNGVYAGSGYTSAPYRPALVLDGAGGVIVFWIDVNAGFLVRAQRLNAGGTPQWAGSGVAISAGAEDLLSVRGATDGAGGAFVVWEELRALPPHGVLTALKVVIRRVTSTGTLAFSPVTLSSGNGDQENPDLVVDGSGNALVTWQEIRSGVSHIYAQKISGSGAVQWAANGITISGAAQGQAAPGIVSDGAGGAILAWQDYRFYPTSIRIYAQRLNSGGAVQWTVDGNVICAQNSSTPAITPDGAGGAIVAWNDTRISASGLYAQRITPSGGISWAVDGVRLSSIPVWGHQVAPDGASGAVVSWYDLRNGPAEIYARRINSAGVPQWSTNGVLVCSAQDNQTGPRIAFSGTAAVVAWHDYRSGNDDIYAQRLDLMGFTGDPAPRIVSMADVPNDQGNALSIRWAGSYRDVDPVYGISDYLVQRQNPDLSWSVVASIPAGPLPGYSAVVQPGSNASPVNFRVMARSSDAPATIFWYSQTVAGQSSDDLPPAAPAIFEARAAGDGAHLSWSPVTEPDLAGYRVYRGETPDFTPKAANRVFDGPATGFVDRAIGTFSYRLTALDANGNESPLVTRTLAEPAGRDLPAALAFMPPAPNPAGSAATLSFTLPAEGRVSIEIFDMNGRRLRSLTDEAYAAGDHRIDWDLRADDGRRVAGGIYAARIVAAGMARTRRIVVVN